MTQHDCSRPGCTRLTSEQECDIHAAEPAGVPHMREAAKTAIDEILYLAASRYGSGDPLVRRALLEVAALRAENERLSTYKERLRGECVGALTEAGIYMLVGPEDPTGPGEVSRAIQRLAAERDEWKRRAEEAQSEAVRIAQVDQHEWVMRASAREAFENYVVRVMAASGADANFDDCFRNIIAEYDKSLARADKAEAERDAAVSLVRDLADRHPCDHFDHHGYCQTHGWMQTDPPCPHGRAAKLLAGEWSATAAPVDPRIEAWRALDAATREEVIGSIIGDGAMHRDVHAIWAAGRCPLDLGPSDGPDPGYLAMAAACDAAAIALEALGEE